MPTVAGIDVSKAFLDVAIVPSQERWRTPNEPDAVDALVRELKRRGVEYAVVEASGGYEACFLVAADTHDLRVARANPRRVRHFARAIGRLAKTDAIDALVIAQFGATQELVFLPKRDPARERLRALLLRRLELQKLVQAERNRQKQAPAWLEESFARVVQRLEAEQQWVEEEMERLLAEAEHLRERAALLQTVPGIGPQVSRTLVALLPELGELTGKQAAALVGVAPFNRESGKQRWRQVTYGGRSEVRRMLYLAVRVAVRYNPVLRQYWLRLRERGKEGKVPMVACIRKLVVMLNAMVRDGRPWSPELHLAAAG